MSFPSKGVNKVKKLLHTDFFKDLEKNKHIKTAWYQELEDHTGYLHIKDEWTNCDYQFELNAVSMKLYIRLRHLQGMDAVGLMRGNQVAYEVQDYVKKVLKTHPTYKLRYIMNAYTIEVVETQPALKTYEEYERYVQSTENFQFITRKIRKNSINSFVVLIGSALAQWYIFSIISPLSMQLFLCVLPFMMQIMILLIIKETIGLHRMRVKERKKAKQISKIKEK